MADTTSSSTQSTDSSLKVSVVTPEETVVETTADSVVLPLFDGEIGILKGHSPMIGRLAFGEMRITKASETERYYVDAGFAQVAGDEVTVLTNHAVTLDKLDGEKAAEQLQEALSRHSSSPVETELRQRAVDQARAQARLAGKS